MPIVDDDVAIAVDETQDVCQTWADNRHAQPFRRALPSVCEWPHRPRLVQFQISKECSESVHANRGSPGESVFRDSIGAIGRSESWESLEKFRLQLFLLFAGRLDNPMVGQDV